MRQALHIFRKDVRYLRLEIGIVLVTALMLSWTETERHSGGWLAETLFTLASCVLIARLVHAEAIPGDTQFWITRPYRWQSLLGAKLFFVVLFVSLPLLMAQFYLVTYVGFSPATFWPGLLWCQALILFCVILPITAMAALTPGITAFISFALLLMGLELVSNAELRSLFGFLRPGQEATTGEFGSVEWVRSSIALLGGALISIGVIYAQYNGRRTVFSRWFAAGAGIVFGLAYLLLPWTAAFKLQSLLSKTDFDSSSLSLKLNEDETFGNLGRGNPGRTKEVPLLFRFSITGIPNDLEARADAVSLAIQGSDGRLWKTNLTYVSARTNVPGSTTIPVYLLVDPEFYRDHSSRPVSVRARVYLTLLGEPQSGTISIRRKWVPAIEGLICSANFLDEVTCGSAFRWPGRAVYAAFGRVGGEAFTTSISYSPFPAMIAFSPFEGHWVSTPKDASTVSIISKKPLSHFERDFEVQGVYLEKFAQIITPRGGR